MNKILDTTVLIKGILEPRRKKRDAVFKEQIRIYKIASSILDNIYNGNDMLFIPTIAIIETAAVASRLTGNEGIGTRTAYFIKSIAAKIFSEWDLLDEAVSIAAKTRISGFDSIFITCAKVTKSILITDDKKMYDVALKINVKAKFLREMQI